LAPRELTALDDIQIQQLVARYARAIDLLEQWRRLRRPVHRRRVFIR
jgi:hypothetical protein